MQRIFPKNLFTLAFTTSVQRIFGLSFYVGAFLTSVQRQLHISSKSVLVYIFAVVQRIFG